VKVRPPQISEQTLREMTEFFMRTSIPRILKKRGIVVDNIVKIERR